MFRADAPPIHLKNRRTFALFTTSRRKREYTSPFSLHEGKLERPKTTRCLQRSEWSLQTESGCPNLHTMAHPWAKKWANLQPMYHLEKPLRIWCDCHWKL